MQPVALIAGSQMEAREYLAPIISEWAQAHDINVIAWNQHKDIHNEMPNSLRRFSTTADVQIRFWSIPENVETEGEFTLYAYGQLLPPGACDGFFIDSSEGDNLLTRGMHVIKDRDNRISAIVEYLSDDLTVIYITFDLPHFSSEIAGHILYRILQDVKLPPACDANQMIVRKVNRGLRHMTTRVQEALANSLRQAIECQIVLAETNKRIVATKEELAVLMNRPRVTVETLQEYELRVKTLPKVYTTHMTAEHLEVVTHCLSFSYDSPYGSKDSQLGRITVYFHWDGGVTFKHKSTYGPSCHPHVNKEGEACWPMLKDGTMFLSVLSNLFLNGQPEIAVQYLITGFLQQINVGDTYYLPHLWKQVTKEAKIEEDNDEAAYEEPSYEEPR